MNQTAKDYFNQAAQINQLLQQFRNLPNNTATNHPKSKNTQSPQDLAILKKVLAIEAKLISMRDNSIEKNNKTKIKKSQKKGQIFNLEKIEDKRSKIMNDCLEKRNHYEDISKSRLDSITFKTISKVKKTAESERLMRFFYRELYNEQDSTFHWMVFKKEALRSNVAEFKRRLVGLSFDKFDFNQRQEISEIRSADYSVLDQNQDLMELLEWLDYKHEGYLAFRNYREVKEKKIPARYLSQPEELSQISGEHLKVIQSTNQMISYLQRAKRFLSPGTEMIAPTLPEVDLKKGLQVDSDIRNELAKIVEKEDSDDEIREVKEDEQPSGISSDSGPYLDSQKSEDFFSKIKSYIGIGSKIPKKEEKKPQSKIQIAEKSEVKDQVADKENTPEVEPIVTNQIKLVENVSPPERKILGEVSQL